MTHGRGILRWVVPALATTALGLGSCSGAPAKTGAKADRPRHTAPATIALPARLRDEPRVPVPLALDLGGISTTQATLAIHAHRAVLSLPSGDEVSMTMTAASGDQPLPSPVPQTRADQQATRSSATWQTDLGRVEVASTQPIRTQFLEDFARGVVPMPRSFAEAAVDGTLEPLTQQFELGGHTFERTITASPDGQPYGLLQRTRVVEPKGPGYDTIADLGGLGSSFAQQLLSYDRAGVHYWLAMTSGGIQIDLAGADDAESIADELTAATFWLVRDRDDDGKADLLTRTSGRPTRFGLTDADD
jgi:hypothetical protein